MDKFKNFPSSPATGVAPGGSGIDGSMVYRPLMALISRTIVRKLVGGASERVGDEDEDALMGGCTVSGIASFV